jgi:hypothetical protein
MDAAPGDRTPRSQSWYGTDTKSYSFSRYAHRGWRVDPLPHPGWGVGRDSRMVPAVRPGPGYFAYSIARDSRMTVTFTWPGYSSSASISRAISCDSRTAVSSSTSFGFTSTLISRPA